MFAVIPTRLAYAYFLLEPNFPDAPPVEPWPDSLINETDTELRAAMLDTWGGTNNSDAFRNTCHPIVYQNRYGSNGHGFIGEYRMTWRLMMCLNAVPSLSSLLVLCSKFVVIGALCPTRSSHFGFNIGPLR